MSITLDKEPTMPEEALKRAEIQEKIRALRKLREDDPKEQRETLAYLMRVLDEDRMSHRKRF